MPGRGSALISGRELESTVAEIAQELGLTVRRRYVVGRRLWGPRRELDLISSDPDGDKRLGVECKYQRTTGTAEEKIPATIEDIKAWPIPGLVVFAGEGFSENMRSFLIASGRAIELDHLKPWLRLFFGLPL